MKSIRLLVAVVMCGGVFDMAGVAGPRTGSETIPLQRYTIIDANNLQQDEGYLLNNGKYELLTSFVGGYEGLSEDVFEPISGRPIMIEEEFDEAKAAGIIPHWTRSKADFSIGLAENVIVSVVGGLDPNPIITIVNQPTNQVVLEGQDAFFSVTASPATYLSYQWLFNGKAISGQIAGFLFFSVDNAKQAGNYSVELNTGGKNVVSKKVGLKVVSPVSIATGPKSQTVKTGHGVVFRVAAKGTSPYTYQWYFNDSPVTHATKSSYSIPKANSSDAGSYSVTVSNQLSGATSAGAVLSVTP